MQWEAKIFARSWRREVVVARAKAEPQDKEKARWLPRLDTGTLHQRLVSFQNAVGRRFHREAPWMARSRVATRAPNFRVATVVAVVVAAAVVAAVGTVDGAVEHRGQQRPPQQPLLPLPRPGTTSRDVRTT